MLEHAFVRTGVIARLRRSPLGSHLDPFATFLHHEGYAARSIQDFVCAAEKFAQSLGVRFPEACFACLELLLSHV